VLQKLGQGANFEISAIEKCEFLLSNSLTINNLSPELRSKCVASTSNLSYHPHIIAGAFCRALVEDPDMKKYLFFAIALFFYIFEPVLAFASHVGDGGPV
jgi:hypothetical protein